MCRFLIVKSTRPIKPQFLLKDFALMCQNSRTPDGDRQGDGWGIAIKIKNWKTHKSLRPIWEDHRTFDQLPQTNLFLAHARSASFADHRGILDYNQPYVDNNLVFVFNGLIRGVKFSHPIPGQIGAQKIFWLLKQQLQSGQSLSISLTHLHQTLLQSAKFLSGFNLGLTQDDTIAALCAYQENKDYFTLYYHTNPQLTLICSQPIGNYRYNKMKQAEVIVF